METEEADENRVGGTNHSEQGEHSDTEMTKMIMGMLPMMSPAGSTPLTNAHRHPWYRFASHLAVDPKKRSIESRKALVFAFWRQNDNDETLSFNPKSSNKSFFSLTTLEFVSVGVLGY